MWTEDTRFLAQPTRSAKKKCATSGPLEGTSSKLHFISDWLNTQLDINFFESHIRKFDRLDQIHHMEQNHTPTKGLAETS